MTLLKQLEVWATGSDLHRDVKLLRLKIVAIGGIILLLVIVSSTFIAGEVYRQQFVQDQFNIKPFLNSRIRREFGRNFDESTIDEVTQQVEDYRTQSFINGLFVFNAYVFLVLLILIWLGLYWVLKPFSLNIVQKESFLKHASHDLRTPLAILHSNLDLVKDSDEKQELQDTIHESQQEIKRLQDLANSYLQGLTNPQEMYTKQSCNLFETIEFVYSKIKSIKHDSITYSNTIDRNYIITVSDVQKFSQIVYNILHNAICYTPHNGKIDISLSNNTLKVINSCNTQSIQDGTGIGICRSLSTELGLQFTITIKNNMCITTLSFS